jgi:enoyl-CoA hydratase/carnithine racemase
MIETKMIETNMIETNMIETIEYSTQGHVAKIMLNNVATHNALGENELLALQQCFGLVEEDKNIRVLIITNHGQKTFCAGAALNQLSTGKISPNSFQDTTDKLAAIRVPSICAINGNVYGGGVELALSCDFRVGIHGSHMRVPAAKLGLCYPINGINRYVERLGVSLSKRILMAAEQFEADELLHVGFLDHLVDASEIMKKTQELADSIALLAPLAVQSMKQLLQQAAEGGIDPDYAEELSKLCAESEDLKEGFAAHREKRAPNFIGR